MKENFQSLPQTAKLHHKDDSIWKTSQPGTSNRKVFQITKNKNYEKWIEISLVFKKYKIKLHRVSKSTVILNPNQNIL